MFGEKIKRVCGRFHRNSYKGKKPFFKECTHLIYDIFSTYLLIIDIEHVKIYHDDMIV